MSKCRKKPDPWLETIESALYFFSSFIHCSLSPPSLSPVQSHLVSLSKLIGHWLKYFTNSSLSHPKEDDMSRLPHSHSHRRSLSGASSSSISPSPSSSSSSSSSSTPKKLTVGFTPNLHSAFPSGIPINSPSTLSSSLSNSLLSISASGSNAFSLSQSHGASTK